jgi:hypothetical protein
MAVRNPNKAIMTEKTLNPLRIDLVRGIYNAPTINNTAKIAMHKRWITHKGQGCNPKVYCKYAAKPNNPKQIKKATKLIAREYSSISNVPLTHLTN